MTVGALPRAIYERQAVEKRPKDHQAQFCLPLLPQAACEELYIRKDKSLSRPLCGRGWAQRILEERSDIMMILEGKADLLVHRLTRLMQEKSAARDFEAAAGIRDQISTLAELSAGLSGVNRSGELEDLKGMLGLKDIPRRIEGFDISNISGKAGGGVDG